MIAFAAGCTRGGGHPGQPPSPNVVLISIDTLRADHVGVHGARGKTATPTLDTLARTGVSFETAFSPAPLTLPSHASLLTGLYPPHHGVRHNGMFRLPDSIPTLAGQLREAGYATAAFVAAIVLQRRFGLDHGFEHYDDRMAASRAFSIGYQEQRAEVITKRVLAWIRGAHQPFFVFAHYYDPHFEYAPPEPFTRRFPRDLYMGEIAYVDSEIGRLLDGMERASLLGNTIVVVTADHGESLGEHGEPTHEYTIYDATQHVPLILRGPGVPAGKTIVTPVSTVDIAPTILSLARASRVASDGQSLIPLWRGKAVPGRALYVETLAGQLDHGWSALYGIRTKDFLYIRAPRAELYDVRQDPAELVNLIEKNPQSVSRVVDRMESALRPILAREKQEAPRVKLDPPTLERLRALGYAVRPEPAAANNVDPKDGLKWALKYFDAAGFANEGKYDKARAIIESMLKALPQSPQAHYLMAKILLEQQRPKDGLQYAEEAVRLNPSFARYSWLRGDLLEALGRHVEARSAYQKGLELAPESPAALLLRLRTAAEKGRISEARRLANQMDRSDPGDQRRLLDVSRVWESVDEISLALAAARRAVRVDPSTEEAHQWLAICLARAGRVDESDAERKKAGQPGRNPRFLNNLAIAFAKGGAGKRAIALWSDMAARSPKARKNLELMLEYQRHLAATKGKRTTGDGGRETPGSPSSPGHRKNPVPWR